jgi:hypothetical protein
MLSNNDIEVTKLDLTLISSVLIFSHLINSQLGINQVDTLFNTQWRNMALATLLGFAFHSLLTNKISIMLIRNLEIDNRPSILSIYDIIKFGTVFVSKEFILAQLNNRSPDFSTRWQKESGFTILGYVIFNILSLNLPIIETQYHPLFNDIIKVTLGELTANIAINGTITYYNLISLIGILMGFITYHVIFRNMIADEKINYIGGFARSIHSLIKEIKGTINN